MTEPASAFTIDLAAGADDMAQIANLRYEVLVAEMGKYQDRADHEARTLVDPEDPDSEHAVARDGDRIVAAMRMTYGDAISDRQIDQYSLQPWIEQFGPELLAVGERTMVHPDYRGTDATQQLMMASPFDVMNRDAVAVFGAAEPHLLSLYISVGQLTYADRNINSEEAGYLIPMVALLPDEGAFRGLGDWEPDEDGSPGFAPMIEEILDGAGMVKSTALESMESYSALVRDALIELGSDVVGAFDGFEEDEIERVLARSNLIECDAGDRVVKAEGTGRNIFVVLEGTLEAKVDDQLVGVLTKGDVFGEIAFLLDQPRTADVFAATNDVRVLSLSDSALRKMTFGDPMVAAKLLFNVSKMLCVRLIKSR